MDEKFISNALKRTLMLKIELDEFKVLLTFLT